MSTIFCHAFRTFSRGLQYLYVSRLLGLPCKRVTGRRNLINFHFKARHSVARFVNCLLSSCNLFSRWGKNNNLSPFPPSLTLRLPLLLLGQLKLHCKISENLKKESYRSFYEQCS